MSLFPANSVLRSIGQYGVMQILSLIFLECHAIPICPAYSHNLLRVHDAAGKNKICNKIKELGRILDTCGLSSVLLINIKGQSEIKSDLISL
jgi:hypothetical protein